MILPCQYQQDNKEILQLQVCGCVVVNSRLGNHPSQANQSCALYKIDCSINPSSALMYTAQIL
ncbi:hypothetical protein L195_g060830, partial [Trifolium pratense]